MWDALNPIHNVCDSVFEVWNAATFLNTNMGQVILNLGQLQYFLIGEKHGVVHFALVFESGEITVELVGVPELVWKDLDTDDDQEYQEDKDSTDMWPDIYKFIVACE